MTIKLIRKRNPTAFEDELNLFISKGFELLQSFMTPDSHLIGILKNGEVEIQAEKVTLDKELVKENKSLNNTIADLEKQIDKKDKDFNAKIEVLQGNIQKNGEGLQERIDQLEEVNDKAGKESIELLKQLEAADKHNTQLSLDVETCKKECTTLKASNTKLKKKIEALIEE